MDDATPFDERKPQAWVCDVLSMDVAERREKKGEAFETLLGGPHDGTKLEPLPGEAVEVWVLRERGVLRAHALSLTLEECLEHEIRVTGCELTDAEVESGEAERRDQVPAWAVVATRYRRRPGVDKDPVYVPPPKGRGA